MKRLGMNGGCMTSDTVTNLHQREHARYGAASQQEFDGPLPQPFPREIGPRAMEYLAEVVDSGLTCDMVGRFERAFAEAYGIMFLQQRWVVQ